MEKKNHPAKTSYAPAVGRVTWNSEGTEGGHFHSRKLHVPSGASGLTIGRGYDMGSRHSGEILRDLTRAGVSKSDAEIISKAAGLKGKAAKSFISAHHLENFEISQPTQTSLFEVSYEHEAREVKRISSKVDVVHKYGGVKWDDLDQGIKDMIIDLKFRGDYTGSSREKIQKYVSENDLRGFAKQICDRDNWKNVPNDRFRQRKEAMEAAIAELDKKESKKKSAIPASPPVKLSPLS